MASNWFFRQDTSHSSTRNGLTPETAWSLTEINNTTNANKVQAGDVVYGCGDMVFAAGVSLRLDNGTEFNPITVRMDWPTAKGSMDLSSANTGLGSSLWIRSSYIVLDGVTIKGGLWLNKEWGDKTQKNVVIRNSTLLNGVGLPSILFDSNIFHEGTSVEDNTFGSLGDAGANTNGGGIKWAVDSNKYSTLTNVSIKRNKFSGVKPYRSVVYLQTGSTDMRSKMVNVVVEDNVWRDCTGNNLELEARGDKNNTLAAGYVVQRNKFFNGLLNPRGFGGAMFICGAAKLNGVRNPIRYNYAYNMQGDVGFIDLLFGSYLVEYNYGDTFTTQNIDAVGIFVDLGTYDTIIRRNKVKNMYGLSGKTNSGCGMLILHDQGGDTFGNVEVYGNIFDGMRRGVFAANMGTDSDTKGPIRIYNNTFANIAEQAFYASTSSFPLLDKIEFRNNFCHGEGVSVQLQTNTKTLKNESNNIFAGFASPINHTLNVTSKLSADKSFGSLDLSSYEPAANSVAVGAGLFIAEVRDYVEDLFNVKPTIGALEIQGSNSVVENPVVAVNEEGAIIVQQGKGSCRRVGDLPTQMAPVNEMNGKSLFVFPDEMVVNKPSTWQDILTIANPVVGQTAFATDIGGGSSFTWNGSAWIATGGTVKLASTAVPVIIPSSGTVGDNGALTLTTALPAVYLPGAWMYFPLGALYANSVAGFYYTIMSSTTVGVVYNTMIDSMYAPSQPLRPTAIVATGPGAYTQATTEILLRWAMLPGGLLGKNGSLFTTFRTVYSNSANIKVVTIKLGTQNVFSRGRTTSTADALTVHVMNRGVPNRQAEITVVQAASTVSYVGNTTLANAASATAADTTYDQQLTLSAQLNVATDFFISEGWHVTVQPQN